MGCLGGEAVSGSKRKHTADSEIWDQEHVRGAMWDHESGESRRIYWVQRGSIFGQCHNVCAQQSTQSRRCGLYAVSESGPGFCRSCGQQFLYYSIVCTWAFASADSTSWGELRDQKYDQRN